MLYSIDDDKEIDYIPHEREYRFWRSHLTDPEYQAIVDELNRKITGTQIQTAGWIPGSDWTGTIYEPIYTKACGGDETDSGLFFGLIVWVVMLNRPERWAFGHYEKDGVPIRSLTYFQVNP